jgi:hypothetical protein
MQWSGLLALGLVLGPAVAWSAPDCGPVASLEDGWTIAAPQEQALDPEPICALGARLAGLKDANAHGVVIARHGALVYEAYLPGEDQRWPSTTCNRSARASLRCWWAQRSTAVC